MTSIEIYKEDILEALTYEPLGAHLVFVDTVDCTACAVGSVIRRFSPDMDELGYAKIGVGLTDGMCVPDLSHTLPQRPDTMMGALSMYYEGLVLQAVPVEEIRTHCIDFVEEHFPEDEVICELPVEGESNA